MIALKFMHHLRFPHCRFVFVNELRFVCQNGLADFQPGQASCTFPSHSLLSYSFMASTRPLAG
jgi:hypothetical protein